MPLLEGSGEPTPSPSLEGTIRVMLDDGNEVEMDAAAYMEQLLNDETCSDTADAMIENLENDNNKLMGRKKEDD